MSDIANAIYRHLRTMAPHQLKRLTAIHLKEAADEIERLRLTDEERDAIAGAIASEHGRGSFAWAATLRSLLERVSFIRDYPEPDNAASEDIAVRKTGGDFGQPTLTDEEREAVECGIQAIGLAPRDERTLAHADTLRGLLERTK